MNGYILSILGIVVVGILFDVIIPSGSISKYIKSIYAIFVVAVIISPVVNFLSNKNEIDFNYQEYQIDSKLINYINTQKVKSLENEIESELKENGYENVDIKLDFSYENEEIKYISCIINLKNLLLKDGQAHINKYEFIKNVVKEKTNMTFEEMLIDE